MNFKNKILFYSDHQLFIILVFGYFDYCFFSFFLHKIYATLAILKIIWK